MTACLIERAARAMRTGCPRSQEGALVTVNVISGFQRAAGGSRVAAGCL